MTNELVLDVSSYGIEESKAKQLEKVFVPMVKKFKELEKEYIEVVSQKVITEQVCSDAKIVRNRYVKVRTGADEIHKIAKASLLIETRAIDGLRNIVKYAVIDHENSLLEVEKHFERIEAEKLEKLREERNSILEKYDVNPGVGDPALMSEDVWGHYIASVELDHKTKIEAEKKAEIERIEKDKAFIKEQKRIRLENERLKKEAELKLISDQKEEKERQRLAKFESDKRAEKEKERLAIEEKHRQRLAKFESDKRDKIEREREAKEKELKLRNIKRNNELQPYIVFIRDYNLLLSSDEKEYQKQIKEIRTGAELQWEFDIKERDDYELTRKKEREAKEKIELELKNRQEQDRKAKEVEDLRVKKEVEDARKLSLAPDKERLTKWVNDMVITNIITENMNQESILIARIVMSKYNSFKAWAKLEIEKTK
ncbi:MAG: hypothetical protein IID16_00870 [Candidatus Marinimicrobia bacterium]|nr:hypothetical protein [Candidatus Neomarinimicrobiota bacterium]